MTTPTGPVLEVRDLSISVARPDGSRATVVDKVNFRIERGGAMGLVGESGSGKTLTSMAIMGLLPRAARVESGEILLEGEDLVKKSSRQMRRIRGQRVAMILQDPMTALDPSFTIHSQLSDPLRQHRGLGGKELAGAVVTAMEQVHLPATKERLRQYPHQLSGGMRQRAVSAIALAGQPRLLIADEPTTALDVTTQARYLQLLGELQDSTGFAVLLVAHDLLVVRHVCQQVMVMYSGQIVEEGPVEQVFADPKHPYTRALIGAIPVLDDIIHLESIDGQAPDVGEELAGCRFAQRCKFSRDICETAVPELSSHGPDRTARCWGTVPEGWIST